MPLKLTSSPVKALPSLVVPVPALSKLARAAVPLTTAVVVASYTLLTGTVRPLMLSALAVMVPVVPVSELPADR